jgi:hypothetical protein
MIAFWLLLLALIIFIMYMWQNGTLTKPAAPGCSACAKKNVAPVE